MAAINVAKDAASHAVYLFSTDQTNHKVIHHCYVPPSLQSSLSALNWTNEVFKVLGGKVGGKAEIAQGISFQVDNVCEAKKIAADFAIRAFN